MALASAALFLFASVGLARVGGGQSYSGGSGGGGGGGGGGELIFFVFRLLFWLTIEHPLIGIPVDVVVITVIVRHFGKSPGNSSSTQVLQLTTVTATPSGQPVGALRRFDPNFSEITFSDFCYSLYGRAHHARGEGKLDQYSPYMSAEARGALSARNPQGLREVRGVVIGSFHVDGLRGIETPQVQVAVSYESNLTEVVGGPSGSVEASWYLRERWVLERKRDILSPPPGKAKADHCPRCGAPLRTRSDGSCESCGVKIEDGTFQWYVRSVALVGKEERGPLLTSNVPEEGTSRPTVWQPRFAEQRAAFEAAHPEHRWDTFEARVRQIAVDLQNAWSSPDPGRDWERVRPLETEGLFQMHRYWIDAYKAQQLRNVVDDFTVTRVESVKTASDAFYESITVRLWARGRDHTDDQSGRVVSGSKSDSREWSEYWTLIRTRSAGAEGAKTMNCPNCGAPVAVGATGVCSSCGGKLTAGAFDWILSRIEQDESYGG